MTSPTTTAPAMAPASRYREGTWRSPGYRSASTRARWTQGLFVVAALASVFELFTAIAGAGLMGDAMHGNVTLDQYASFQQTANGADGLYLWTAIALAIAFLMWLSRTVEVIPALGAGTPADSPRWAIGWWFVPFANLWKPYTVVREAWDRLATPARLADAKLVLAWWLTWLASSIVARFVSYGTGQYDATLESVQGLFIVLALAEAGSVAAAVLGFLVVREIQSRADEWAARQGFEGPLPSVVPPPAAVTPLAPSSVPSAPTVGADTSHASTFCPDCGIRRQSAAAFCTGCGHDFRGSGATSPEPAQWEGPIA